MANTNFLQFDVNQQNMLNDTEYNSDAQRVSGVSGGIARSQLYNKTLFQSSTMVKALADLMVDGGQNVMDNNLIALKQTIKNSFITAWANNIFSGDNTFSGAILLNGSISASSSIKQTIIGWGCPDFASGIAIDTTYTAPQNGFLWLWVRANDAHDRIAKINDVEVFHYYHSGSYSTSDNIWIPISAGDVYEGNIAHRMFFPVKGV